MKTVSARQRSFVPHSTRPEVRGVLHVVLRIGSGLPWLRTPKTYRVLEGALRAGKEKNGFALVQYSVQQDHLHLLVETERPHDPDRQGAESLLAPPRRPRVRRSILRSARRGCSLAQARARLRFEQWPQARRVVFTDAARPLLVRSLVHRLVGTDRYLPTAPSGARRSNTQRHPRLAELPQSEGRLHPRP